MQKIVPIAIIISVLCSFTACFQQLTQQPPVLNIDSTQPDNLEASNEYFTILSLDRDIDCDWGGDCYGNITAVVKTLKDVQIWEAKQQITTGLGKFKLTFPDSLKKIHLKKGEQHTFDVEYYQSWVDMLLFTITKEIYVNCLGIKVLELDLGWKI